MGLECTALGADSAKSGVAGIEAALENSWGMPVIIPAAAQGLQIRKDGTCYY